MNKFNVNTEQYKEALKQYNINNNKQLIEKLKMNSTYGKLAWAKDHDISNAITASTDFILS